MVGVWVQWTNDRSGLRQHRLRPGLARTDWRWWGQVRQFLEDRTEKSVYYRVFHGRESRTTTETTDNMVTARKR